MANDAIRLSLQIAAVLGVMALLAWFKLEYSLPRQCAHIGWEPTDER